MHRDLKRMASMEYDVVVVGGGIHGACAAWEAVRRGLRVALVEAEDFGHATTSNSLRTFHGGLRYLQQLDLKRMRESIRERREWLRLARDIVKPMRFVLPTSGYGMRGPAALYAALIVNDLVSYDRNDGVWADRHLPHGEIWRARRAHQIFAGTTIKNINGAAVWYDAICQNTERLLIALLTATVAAGVQVANYARAVEVRRDSVGTSGVRVLDEASGREYMIRSRAILNAAGPWVDQWLGPSRLTPGPLHFAASKAFNLITRPLPWVEAIALPCSSTYFAIPWNGRTLIGTRHVRCLHSSTTAHVTADEVHDFLHDLNTALGKHRITPSDVVGVFSGLLPEREDNVGTDVALLKTAQIIDHGVSDGIHQVDDRPRRRRASRQNGVRMDVHQCAAAHRSHPETGSAWNRCAGDSRPDSAAAGTRRASGSGHSRCQGADRPRGTIRDGTVPVGRHSAPGPALSQRHAGRSRARNMCRAHGARNRMESCGNGSADRAHNESTADFPRSRVLRSGRAIRVSRRDRERKHARSCMRPNDKIKLLYVSIHDPHVPLTGTGARVGAFVNQLARRHHVDLVYLDGSGQPPSAKLSAHYANSVTGVASKVCIPYSQRGYFLFSKELYRAAAARLEQERYDYIICDYGLSAIYGLLLSRRFRTPFIYSSHNIEYRANLGKARFDPRRLPLALYMYAAEKMAVKRASCVIAIAPADADVYAGWIPRERMLVIPQGFDERDFNPWYSPPQNARKTILFCGNFKIQMNRDVVHTVMDHILKPVLAKHPDALFRFVGAWPPTEVKHPNVEFTGFLEDYPAALKSADVVISPMLVGYGFPTKIVEALACGKPTVTTHVGGRALEKDYHILRFAEVDTFATEICGALDEAQPVTDVDHGKVKARYSWDALVGRLSDWIENDARRARRLAAEGGTTAHVSGT
jgi:glycerol-3-phosphate dehydrogenase/glycosyltransferase involved in cell wall biosynthesis